MNPAEAIELATVELVNVAIRSEVEADLAYDHKAQTSALKKPAFPERLHLLLEKTLEQTALLL